MSSAPDQTHTPPGSIWESQTSLPFEFAFADSWTNTGYNEGLWNPQATTYQGASPAQFPSMFSQSGIEYQKQLANDQPMNMTSPALLMQGLEEPSYVLSESDSTPASIVSPMTRMSESSICFPSDSPGYNRREKPPKLAQTNLPTTFPSSSLPYQQTARAQSPQQHQQKQQGPQQQSSEIKVVEKPIQERNRIAAEKYRSRQRTANLNLESHSKELEIENKELLRTLMQLSEEMYALKQLLLAHSNCNCELIQKYLRTSASKWVNRCEGNNKENTGEGSTHFLGQP